jgi:hypothetical protein
MKRTANAVGAEPKTKNQHTSALERERKEQLEETRRWISANALKKFRRAWRH